MEYFSNMSLNIKDLVGDEKILAARINEYFSLSRSKNITKYTTFLNERQQAMCHSIAKGYGDINYCFNGGYVGAERAVLCILSSYDDTDTAKPLITAVTFEYRKQDALSHRDFLGSLMGLMITREQIGDILVEDGRACIFLTKQIAPVVLTELTKVGRVGVSSFEGCLDPLPNNQDFIIISDTVASLRLDCVLASALNLSREKTSMIIAGGTVMINSMNCDNNSYILSQGDKISAKGHGKFLLEEIGGQSKKGKTYISLKKYL